VKYAPYRFVTHPNIPRAHEHGVTVDEEHRRGLNPRKRQRLLDAGADLIVTDFLHHSELLHYLTCPIQPSS